MIYVMIELFAFFHKMICIIFHVMFRMMSFATEGSHAL